MGRKILNRSLNTSSEEYKMIEEQFYALAIEFNGKAPPEQSPVWEKIDNFLNALVINKGWNRKSIYELVSNVLDKEWQKGSTPNNQAALSEEAFDALTDFESAMIGFVHRDCIPRFPGEPADEQEFLDYVYSEKWLE
jgi:hypothetical protein